MDDDVDVSEFIDGISCIDEFSTRTRDELFKAVTRTPDAVPLHKCNVPHSAVALVFRRGVLADHSDSTLLAFHSALESVAASNFSLTASADAWLHHVVALVAAGTLPASSSASSVSSVSSFASAASSLAASSADVRAVSVRGDASLLLVLVSRCAVPSGALLAELSATVSPALLTDLRVPLSLLCVRNDAFSAHPSRDAMLAALAQVAAGSASATTEAALHVADCVLRISARGPLSLVVFEFVGSGADVVAAVRNRLDGSSELLPMPSTPSRNPSNVLRRTSSSASIFQRRSSLQWSGNTAISPSPRLQGSGHTAVTMSPAPSPGPEEDSSEDSAPTPARRSISNDVYVRVIAVRDHLVEGQRRLSFRRDEAFTVAASSMTDSDWLGFHKGRRGLFPKDAVAVIDEKSPSLKLPTIAEEE